jgi:hypothetical protein
VAPGKKKREKRLKNEQGKEEKGMIIKNHRE